MDNRKLKHLIIERLVECFQKKPSAVAKALDEEIDRTGNLLGWLRELSNGSR